MIHQAKQFLQENEFLRSLLEHNPDGFVLLDPKGLILQVNPIFTQITGCTESELLGRHYSDFVNYKSYTTVAFYLEEAMHGHPYSFEVQFNRKQEGIIDLSAKFIPLRAYERIVGVYGFIRDITMRKQIEKSLLEDRQRYRLISENMGELIKILNADGEITFVSSSHTKTIGRSPNEHINRKLMALVHPNDQFLVQSRLCRIQTEKCNQQMEYRFRHKEGHWVTVEAVWTPVLSLSGALDSIVIVARDITMRKGMEQRLTYLAYHDPLTGLANRSLLLKRLSSALSCAQGMGHSFAVLYVDLDRFKSINDSLGHAVGDRLLQEAAKRLTSCPPQGSTIGRMGGDEFAVIIPYIQSASEAEAIAGCVVESFQDHFLIESHELHITPSVGISIYPRDGDVETELLRNADKAMYHTKHQGKNSFQFYHRAMDQYTNREFQIERDLHRALEANEFTLYYQPLIRIADRSIIGVEALLRWEHPTLGWISPNEFIPIAEESGVIVPLGNWILEKACRELRQWQEEGIPPIQISVNISARQLLHARFVDTVLQILDKTGVDPSCIAVEITETMMMENMEQSRAILLQLRNLGMTVSIDDFGTGYSSLNYLRKLPIDVLKIDRSFIDEIKDQSDQAELVKAIIAMARSLGKRVLAEGVETQVQFAFLAREGCDAVQGYFFSQPLHPREIPALLKPPVPQHQGGQISIKKSQSGM